MFTEVSVLISLQSACDLTEKSLNVWIQKTKQKNLNCYVCLFNSSAKCHQGGCCSLRRMKQRQALY